MEDELEPFRRRLDLAKDKIDREICRFESFGHKDLSSLSGRRLRVPDIGNDPFLITLEQALRRSVLNPGRLRACLQEAKKELLSHEGVVKNTPSLVVKISRDVRQLEARLAKIAGDLTGSVATPERRAQLSNERNSINKKLSEKREALRLATEAIERSREVIPKLRDFIPKIERILRRLFEARNRSRQQRRRQSRRRGCRALGVLALLGSRRTRF